MKIKNILNDLKNGFLSGMNNQKEVMDDSLLFVPTKSNKNTVIKIYNINDLKSLSLNDLSDIKEENYPKGKKQREAFIVELNKAISDIGKKIEKERKNINIDNKINNHLKDYVFTRDNTPKVLNENKNSKSNQFQKNNNKNKVENFKNKTNTSKNTANQQGQVSDYYLRKIAEKESNLKNAYVSYPSSADSLKVYANKLSLTIFINGLSHENEKSIEAIKCKTFLNSNLKKQRIYYEPISFLTDDTLVANVYLDINKTINIADIAKKHNFHKSEAKIITEDNLIIPENETLKTHLSNDLSDVSFKDNTEIHNISEDNLFKKHKDKRVANSQVGYVLDFGNAKYLFDESKSYSFFIKLQLATKETILWGTKLDIAIKNSGAKKGDFIVIEKRQEILGNKTINEWNLSVLEKLNSESNNSLNSYKQENNNDDISDIPFIDLNSDPFLTKDNNFNSSIIRDSSVIDDETKNVDSEISNNSLGFLFENEDNPFSNSPSKPNL